MDASFVFRPDPGGLAAFVRGFVAFFRTPFVFALVAAAPLLRVGVLDIVLLSDDFKAGRGRGRALRRGSIYSSGPSESKSTASLLLRSKGSPKVSPETLCLM